MKQCNWAARLLVVFCLWSALPAHAQQSVSPAGVLSTVKVFEEHRSQPGTFQFETEVPPFGVEHQVRLSLDARIDSPTLAGSNPWMIVKVNGSIVDVSTLLNKTDTFLMRNGVELTWYQANKKAWRILYSPDFELALKSDSPSALLNTDPYHFVWDITPLVRPGKNVIEVTHLPILSGGSTLVLRDGKIEVGKAILPPASEMVLPAPTGPLPSFAPRPTPRLPIKVEGAPGEIRVSDGAQTVVVGTRTSLPEGAWWKRALMCTLRDNPDSNALSWQTPEYSVQRKIEVQGHRVAVTDTFTNRTEKMIGVLVEHFLLTPSETSPVHLAGRNAKANPFRIDNGSNPSVHVQTENGGAALLAEGDIFRAHAVLLRDGERAALADHNLGIGPRASVTLQWAIYPLPRGAYGSGDYWDFVNAVRSDWKTNFAIPGPFAFMNATAGKTVPEVKQTLDSRGLEIICGSIAKFSDGKYAHGTGILFAPEFVQQEKEWIEKVHQAAPGVKTVCYFHAQISTEPDATTKYAADRDHDTGGKEMSYPYKYDLPMFIPTEKNEYGKALWGYVKTITETIGADGLYWDEMSHSVNEYATNAPWDNCSAQIDPKTHRLIKPLTNVPLILQPLRLQILEYLRANNRFIMANTQAQTQTMTAQQIVRFVETNTYSALADAQLECPLGLGNHHPENTPGEVAKNVREMLLRGCYYYGHHYYREAPAWDFLQLMYPMTPQQLGPGFIIGSERIATATPGDFAFADGARAEIYEVDKDGARVQNPGVQERENAGKFSYEVRIPGDHFVILVRR